MKHRVRAAAIILVALSLVTCGRSTPAIPNICPVHGSPLKDDTVRIVYGLIEHRNGIHNAQRDKFPWANDLIEGGCVVSTESPKFGPVRYCPACREAKLLWRSEHEHLIVRKSPT